MSKSLLKLIHKNGMGSIYRSEKTGIYYICSLHSCQNMTSTKTTDYREALKFQQENWYKDHDHIPYVKAPED